VAILLSDHKQFEGGGMARLIFGMMQSLDGYVACPPGSEDFFPGPGPELHQHFNDQVRGVAGSLYGRVMYEMMRYWDEDQDDWGPIERDYAAVWRAQPKWVVSRTLQEVGPNATLVRDDPVGLARRLKDEVAGDIDVSGPILAGALSGLIDEYRLYYRPFVFGGGHPFFTGPRPPLRIVSTDRVGEDAVRVTCIPA
jgi:dihydrofolate reductase